MLIGLKKMLFLLVFVFFLSFWASGADAALNVQWPNSPMNTPLNETTDLTHLIKYLYEWAISLSGLAVFIILVYAGFQYLTSAGNSAKLREAKSRIRDAIFGLGLLLGSVLILNTINPQLTQLRIPPLGPQDAGSAFGGPVEINLGGKQCDGVEIFSSTEFKNKIGETLTGKSNFPSATTVRSVSMNGDCLLTLYQRSNQQSTETQPPSMFATSYTEISADVSFLSYQVSNIH